MKKLVILLFLLIPSPVVATDNLRKWYGIGLSVLGAIIAEDGNKPVKSGEIGINGIYTDTYQRKSEYEITIGFLCIFYGSHLALSESKGVTMLSYTTKF